MIIKNNKYNSLPEQVQENLENIKTLASIIKELYKCVGDLGNASVSISRSLTNIPDNESKGWLIDSVGNLYKINGGDNSSLLIEYYSTLRGEKGDTGATGATGARGYSLRYLYIDYDITQHIPPYIDNIRLRDVINVENIQIGDIVLYNNGVLGLISNILDINIQIDNIIPLNIETDGISVLDIPFEQFIGQNEILLNNEQLILLQDNNILYLILPPASDVLHQIITKNYDFMNNTFKYVGYEIDSTNNIVKINEFNIDTTTLRMTINTIELGPKLYKHNIIMYTDRYNFIQLEITNSNNIPIASYNKILAYLEDNGFDNIYSQKLANGYFGGNRTTGIFVDNGTIFKNSGADLGGSAISTTITIEDNIETID